LDGGLHEPEPIARADRGAGRGRGGRALPAAARRRHGEDAAASHASDKLRNLTAWIAQIGVAALESNTDFSVGAGNAQAFNDTLVQINTDLEAFMTTNREKIERLARGE
jgi:hypothetical protein